MNSVYVLDLDEGSFAFDYLFYETNSNRKEKCFLQLEEVIRYLQSCFKLDQEKLVKRHNIWNYHHFPGIVDQKNEIIGLGAFSSIASSAAHHFRHAPKIRERLKELNPDSESHFSLDYRLSRHDLTITDCDQKTASKIPGFQVRKVREIELQLFYECQIHLISQKNIQLVVEGVEYSSQEEEKILAFDWFPIQFGYFSGGSYDSKIKEYKEFLSQKCSVLEITPMFYGEK